MLTEQAGKNDKCHRCPRCDVGWPKHHAYTRCPRCQGDLTPAPLEPDYELPQADKIAAAWNKWRRHDLANPAPACEPGCGCERCRDFRLELHDRGVVA